VALLTIFFIVATARWSLVPSRLQSAAELSYEFVGKMVQSTAGTEGMKFFPFVFTLFMFVLTLNMISLIPHTFSVTSQIIITAALALTVFFTVVTYGFIKHGFHFLNVFVPKGVPMYILPLIVFIELMSFLSTHFSTGIPILNRICGWKATRYRIHLSREASGVVRFCGRIGLSVHGRKSYFRGDFSEDAGERSILVFY
jgi:F-type H+-transporting ATPase subunit a